MCTRCITSHRVSANQDRKDIDAVRQEIEEDADEDNDDETELAGEFGDDGNTMEDSNAHAHDTPQDQITPQGGWRSMI